MTSTIDRIEAGIAAVQSAGQYSGVGAIRIWKDCQLKIDAEEPTPNLRWNKVSGLLEQMWMVGTSKGEFRNEWRAVPQSED